MTEVTCSPPRNNLRRPFLPQLRPRRDQAEERESESELGRLRLPRRTAKSAKPRMQLAQPLGRRCNLYIRTRASSLQFFPPCPANPLDLLSPWRLAGVAHESVVLLADPGQGGDNPFGRSAPPVDCRPLSPTRATARHADSLRQKKIVVISPI